MTEEEINAVRIRRKKERQHRYTQTEAYKEKARIRSKERHRRIRERMQQDPEFRELMHRKYHEIYMRHRILTHGRKGRHTTLTRHQQDIIAQLHSQGRRTATIARQIDEPYNKVWHYIKMHIEKKNRSVSCNMLQDGAQRQTKK